MITLCPSFLLEMLLLLGVTSDLMPTLENHWWEPKHGQLCQDDLEHLWEWSLCTPRIPVRVYVIRSLTHLCMLEADSNHEREKWLCCS